MTLLGSNFLYSKLSRTPPDVSVANLTYGAIAQLVEHLHGMQGVSGSSPLGSIVKTQAWLGFFLCLAHAVQMVRGTQMHPDTPVWRTIWRKTCGSHDAGHAWVLAPSWRVWRTPTA